MDIRSSLPMPTSPAPSGYGGTIPSGDGLPVNRINEVYAVEGSRTVKRLTSLAKGARVVLHFNAPITLTNSTTLICPGGVDAIFAAGDYATLYSEGDGIWRLVAINRASAVVLQGYLAGLTLSTAGSSSTFGITSGVATDSTNTLMMSLLSSYTKTTGDWAVGSGNGALDTGTIANSAWYHAFLIQRPDTGLVDPLISLSATSPTLPAGYTYFRRIGSMCTDGSGHWIKFVQDGDKFQWDIPVLDVAATNPGTSAVTRTLSVPSGVRVEASLLVVAAVSADTGFAGVYISDLAVADGAPGAGIYSNFISTFSTTTSVVGIPVKVMTNTSAQVRSRVQFSTANDTLDITTLGWSDPRGRL